jgi:bifunctional DNA-binding transcriptional regulator/antitoxin component of YhaV-PrlF toxin-antitoxin module
MASATSRVTAQNQTSVPADIRRRFSIRAGTVLEWRDVNGALVVRPRQVTLDDVRTEVKKMIGTRRLSLAGLKNARAAAAVAKYDRGRR